MTSSLYYPLVVNSASEPTYTVALPVDALPSSAVDGTCVVLTSGTMGLYVRSAGAWSLVLFESDFSAAAILGYHVTIFINPVTVPDLVVGALIYQDGVAQPDTPSIPTGAGIWLVTDALRGQYITADAGGVFAPSILWPGGQGFYTDVVSGGALANDLGVVINGGEILRFYSGGVLITGQLKVSGTIEARAVFTFTPS